MSAATLAASSEADDATISAIDALRADDRHLEAREHYGHLVGRHQRRALSIAYRMLRDPADAEEVVQDAFVKAYLHLPSFRRELPFAAWFTRILTNSCRDRIKARSRRDRREHRVVPLPSQSPHQREVWDRIAAATTSPEDQLLAQEKRDVLSRALARLSARQRAVVALRHLEGLTSSELSALTGWNPSTIRVHLFRGLRNLRAILAESESHAS